MSGKTFEDVLDLMTRQRHAINSDLWKMGRRPRFTERDALEIVGYVTAEFERLRSALRHIEGAALDISVDRASIAKAARNALEGKDE